MEVIHTLGKYNLPEVILDKEGNRIIFSGKSMPEDAITFFAPILKWFDAYAEDPNENTSVDFKLEYFNTSSLKKIIEILNRVKVIHDKGLKTMVRWHYIESDEDMLDTGKAFEELLNIPFEYLPYD